MDLNTRRGGVFRRRGTEPRLGDIRFIAARLERNLIAARAPHASETTRLHNVFSTAISTVIEMTTRQPLPVPFDIYNGLGELRDVMLEVIRSEYRRILDPEPATGLVDILTMATGGLMMRAVSDRLDHDLEREVDLHLSVLLRSVA
ncbi:MAG: hypothetical protein JWR83_2637 [Aeromicrobium sp.]|nr:hypothetical protein [Aeromicrobium sp.]